MAKTNTAQLAIADLKAGKEVTLKTAHYLLVSQYANSIGFAIKVTGAHGDSITVKKKD